MAENIFWKKKPDFNLCQIAQSVDWSMPIDADLREMEKIFVELNADSNLCQISI